MPLDLSSLLDALNSVTAIPIVPFEGTRLITPDTPKILTI